MREEKFKKVLSLLWSLSLAIILTATNVYATELPKNQSESREEVTEETVNEVMNEKNVQNGEVIGNDETVSNTENTVSQQTEIDNETKNVMEKENQGISKINNDSHFDELIKNGLQLDLNSLDINDVKIYMPPIPVGTALNSVIGYAQIMPYNEGTTALIEITGDMIKNFDSSDIGIKYCTLTMGKWDRIVEIEVSEDADLNDIGKIVSTNVRVGMESSKKKNVVLVGDKTTEYGFIEKLDKRGEIIYEEVFNIKDNCPDYDTSTFGDITYTMNYNGSPITFTINFRRTKFIIHDNHDDFIDLNSSIITLPLNGDIKNTLRNKRGYTAIYDADDGSPYGMGNGFFYYNEVIDEVIKKFDSGKAGMQEIEVTLIEERGIIITGTIIVNVGIAKQSNLDELLSPEAKTTIPSGQVSGVWDVPSGEDGAGTWTFQTNLAENSEVDVWSFHNNEWLKIGIYKVDAYGVVTVTFSADQLSPVLIMEHTKDSEDIVNNGSNSSNDAVLKNNTTEITSPKRVSKFCVNPKYAGRSGK